MEGCKNTTPEIIREMKALLAEYELKKDERQKTKDALAAAMSGSQSHSTPSMPHGATAASPSFRAPHSSFGESPDGSFSTASQGPSSGPNYFIPRNVPGAQPSLEGTGWNKEKHHEARMVAANFWYYNNLPFNVANNPY